MVILGVLLLVLSVATIALILQMKENLMTQTEDLRAAIAELNSDLSAAITRVEDKIASLGEPDPDLSADIQALKDASSALEGLVAAPTPDPDPTPDPVPDPTDPPTPT